MPIDGVALFTIVMVMAAILPSKYALDLGDSKMAAIKMQHLLCWL